MSASSAVAEFVSKEDYVAAESDSILSRIYSTGIIHKHINASLDKVKRSFSDCSPIISKVTKARIPRRLPDPTQFINDVNKFKDVGNRADLDVSVFITVIQAIADIKLKPLPLWKYVIIAGVNNFIATIMYELKRLSLSMEESYGILKRVHNHELEVPITDPSLVRHAFTNHEGASMYIYVSCVIEAMSYLYEVLRSILNENDLQNMKTFIQESKLYRKISSEIILYDVMTPNVEPSAFVLHYHKDFMNDPRSKYEIIVDMVENVPLDDPKQAYILRNHIFNEYFHD